jgi:hypothetical protein
LAEINKKKLTQKMKIKTILLFLVISTNSMFSQENIKMKIKSAVVDNDLRNILNFENIDLSKIELSGKELIGKNYQINIKEYKNGKLTSTSELFESSSYELFKIKNKIFKFTLLTKIIDKTKLKIALKFDRFGSKTLFFDLTNTKFPYVMKDFLGQKGEVEISLDKVFYITSIISPTMHEDGSGSYCEVVQNGNPEELGEKFKIPHYFLVEMKIIN